MNRHGRPWVLLALTLLAFVAGALLPGEQREAISRTLSVGGMDAYAHLFFVRLLPCC